MSSGLFHLLFLLLLLLPLRTSQRKISLSSLDPKPKLVSPSGEFAFGFYPISGQNLFLLATWFDKEPHKTIIWTANGGNTVPKGSKAELTTEGRFLLTDQNGRVLWRAKAKGGGRFASAAMHDDGNFVLTGETLSDRKWTTFEDATDTILPGQILEKGRRISARLSETNYTRGRFQLRIVEDGDVAFYPLSYPTETNYSLYYETHTTGLGTRLVFSKTDANVYVELSDGNRSGITQASVPSLEDYYHRATLDYDGVFRQYYYPKVQEGNTVNNPWFTVRGWPLDICSVNFGGLGSGACGFNSYCILDENQKPTCKCPPGYSFFDEKEIYRGCKQDFVSHSCKAESSEKSQFTMVTLSRTDWPFSGYERYSPANEIQCKDACWEDCLCALATFTNDTCIKKRPPFSNGRSGNMYETSFFKVRRNTSEPCERGKDRKILILVGSLLLGSSGFLNFLMLVTISLATLYIYHKKRVNLKPNSNSVGMNLQRFSYGQLEHVTNGFKQKIGGGSFGTVYKGVLPSDSGIFIAIKMLDKMFQQGEREFKTEVSTISNTHHKNLIRLLGYCDEEPHRALVYEFLPNGSLAGFLFGSIRPNWNQRYTIVLGIARGLTYLHEECNTKIIHCDIKPENILLDESFTAKISDFGLAKLLTVEQTRTITSIRGTRGYVSPEFFVNTPIITAKSDVYSFGVMLLEIICCRKNIELEVGIEEKLILTDWAYDCYTGRRIRMLVENDDEAMNDMEKVERLVMLAICCIQEDPSLRPSMKVVTEMLDGAANISVPPSPSFLSSASITSQGQLL